MSDPLDQFTVKDIREVITPEEIGVLVELSQKIDSLWLAVDVQQKERNKLLRNLPFKAQEEINRLRKSKKALLEELKEQKRQITKNFKEEVAKLRVERRRLVKENKELNENALRGRELWAELNKLQTELHSVEGMLRDKYKDKLK